MKNKFVIAVVCFLTDLVVSVWTYFKASNYQQFIKMIGEKFDSPDFQLQIYQIFLQTLTFCMIFFLLIHLAIYIFYSKDKKLAAKYVHFYCGCAAILMLFTVITAKEYVLVAPTIGYGWCFISARNLLKIA